MSFVWAAVPDGYIVKADSAAVYLDWGKASGVQTGDAFKMYRPGDPLKHPVTGEILGQTEEDLGRGVVDHLEDKYSTGKVLEGIGRIKSGDRTRYVVTSASPSATAPVPALTPPAVPAVVRPQEIWRSDAVRHEAIGLAVGDVTGDGKKDVVVAYRDQIEVFQWNGQKLESLAVFKGHGYTNYLAVETADIEGAGHDKIFATLYMEGVKRSKTVVLDYAPGALREVGHVEGFVRALERTAPDAKRDLLVQGLSMARELRVQQPVPLLKEGNAYREGKPMKLDRALNDDQLFGFAWGDWDGDGADDFAFLQNGERLRVFFSAPKASADSRGGKGATWSSKERYGGTKADFGWENDQVASLFPRLVNWKPVSGKTQLLVPHNIPATPIRLARLKIYRESEIVDLAWNGLEMAPAWTLPVAGVLADFGTGDVMQRGTPQLWVAAVDSGDKTVLIAYQVP